MLERFGVTEANWQDAVKKDPNYATSGDSLYAGRAVAALAADPNIMKNPAERSVPGGYRTSTVFCDSDGRRPHWGRISPRSMADTMNPATRVLQVLVRRGARSGFSRLAEVAHRK